MNLDVLLAKAKVKAEASTCRLPMTTVILRGNKQIAWGVNKKGFRGSSIHSEIDALRHLRYRKRRANGTTAFVTRFTPTGRLGNAKPCANCIETLRLMGVKQVAWTTAKQTVEMASIDMIENDYIPFHSIHKGCDHAGLEAFSKQGS